MGWRLTMGWRVGLACWLAAWLGAVGAQPVEAFFQRAAAREMQLSPSGRLLAFTAARDASRVGLYLRDLDSGETKALAQFSDIDIVDLQWAGEQRLLFATTDLGDQEVGSSAGAPGLFAVGVDGGRPRELIQRRSWWPSENLGGTRSQTGLDFRHRLLAAPVGGGDEVLVGRYEGNAGNDLERVVPLWLNTRNATTRHYASDAPDGAVQWWFDPQGQARLVRTREGALERLHWRGPADKAWRQIAEGESGKLPFEPAFVDGIGSLFLTQARGPRGERVLTRFDFERGAPQAEAMVELPGFDFRGRLLVGDDGAALGLRMLAERETTVWFRPALQQLQRDAEARFAGRTVSLSCRRCGEPEMRALAFVDADRDPGQFWLYSAKTNSWQGLVRLREAIDPAAMAEVGLHRIVARDGRPLPVWVTRSREAKGPQPTLVLVHGGPWVRGGHWRWSGLAQFLASRGYLVIEPEFRGSDGYGLAHLRAGDRQWGLAMQDDLVDALAWAQRRGLAAADACIMGASYGGYATLMGLIRHPQQFRCGVSWVGVSDPLLYLQGSVWVDDDISRSARRHLLPQWVGDADSLRAVSPLLRAAEIKAPLLLAYGKLDRRVPLAHGERLRDAMRAAGHEPEWLVYEDEGHGWRTMANQIDFARRVEAFLAQHLLSAAATTAPPAPARAD